MPNPTWLAPQVETPLSTEIFDQCRFGLKVLERRFRGVTPRISVQIQNRTYQVKTIQDWKDWVEVLKLRHEVFHQEGMGRTLLTGMDVDDIDFLCDHLAIEDQANKKIVATYRLTSSSFSSKFYSQKRFDISGLLDEPGIKLELGRACVKSDARNGSTLHLLWRGISSYTETLGASLLLGSTSIRTLDPVDVAAVCRYLIEGDHYETLPNVHAHAESRFPNLELLIDKMNSNEAAERAKQILPPLFLSYLKAGAKVVCPPAMDRYLGTTDFLTVLRVKEARGRFERRYLARKAS